MPRKNDERFSVVSPIELEAGDGAVTSDIEVLRVGIIRDRGLRITKGMLEDYVRNFKANVWGSQLQVNFGHDKGGEAAGWIKDLFIKGDSLMAKVEWTELGAEKIRKKLYLFVSSELAHKAPHADTGKPVSNVFTGVALTNAPALKGQRPIALSEDEGRIIYQTLMLKELIADLSKRKAVSRADVAFVKTQLEAAPAEEQEELKADFEKLDEACTKAEKLAAKEEEKKKKAAAADDEEEGEEEEDMADKTELTRLARENKDMKVKLERREVKEMVEEKLSLDETSGDVSTGFAESDLEAVTTFMLSLDEKQREQAIELFGKVKTVDFKTRGARGDESEKGGSNEEKIANLADKLYAKHDGKKSMAECQDLAMSELGINLA